MIKNALKGIKTIFYENFETVRQTIPTDKSVISFTFDDAPLSCMEKGAKLLEQAGYAGTYYLSGKLALLERTTQGPKFINPGEAISLKHSGHQIACHTYSHKWLGAVSAQQYAQDCERNRIFWKEQLDTPLVDFAYPLGKVSLRGKHLIKHQYRSLRGIQSGINRNATDMACLRSVGISNDTFDKLKIAELIADCKENGGWLIFFAHGIDETSLQPHGTNSRDFKWVLDVTRDAGTQVLTIEAARELLLPGAC